MNALYIILGFFVVTGIVFLIFVVGGFAWIMSIFNKMSGGGFGPNGVSMGNGTTTLCSPSCQRGCCSDGQCIPPWPLRCD